ncbi:phasin family protein [Azospirillum sp.]|uniref:phasin family protein n=1 Tax=Azospirillum sp. TaxID=34012 RepID=UPI002D749824|nr:phasin family protein [Azospirillum sp.]HYD67459.1 phasin family protein [Azospirillum sp.]
MAIDKDTNAAAARSAERATEATVRRAADATRQITNQITDQTADTIRDTNRELTGAAARTAEQGSDQLKRMFGLSTDAQEEVTHQAQQNLDAMVQCGSVLMDGFQQAWREWLGLAQEVAQRHGEGVGAMMRSRSVQDFYGAQSALVKDEVEMLLTRSVKLSELSAKIGNDAVRRMNERNQGAAKQTRLRA